MYTMNRCFLSPKHQLMAMFLATGLALALSAPVAAQTMPARIPPISQVAKSGVLEVIAPPEVMLDGKATRLSPGAKIHGQNNLVVLSASLVGQKLRVLYVRDTLALVHEVWILTEAEIAALPKADPASQGRP
jgi:hypothetical protein